MLNRSLIAAAIAAVAISAPAAAYTYVDMGTLSPSNDRVYAGRNPAQADASTVALDASNMFDIRGGFGVTTATEATAFSTQLDADGLGQLTANIYTSDGAGGLGNLVATVPAAFSSSAIWVFQSPVAFSLDPGNYVFDVAGSKTAGSVLQYQLAVTAVPLPASAFMFGAGLLVIGGLAARRKQASAQAI